MKYVLIALLVIVVCLGTAWVGYPDQVLAYTDHRLIDVSRLSGNPEFLLQLRNQVHGFRYARQMSLTPVNVRIVRAPSPKQVLPPPTPVIDPRLYTQGAFPPKMQRQGVLGPNQPTPPKTTAATGTPFTFTEDFENKFAGNVNHDYCLGWTGYTVWGQPTADGEFTTRHSGTWAQKISGEATWRGGIFHQFNMSPYSLYSLKVFGHLYVLGGGAIQVGVDPNGGTNPSASSVLWLTAMTNLGQWSELDANGQALGSQITVFLEGYSLYDDNTNAYFDDFTLNGFAPI
jgi:hypothetical protein